MTEEYKKASTNGGQWMSDGVLSEFILCGHIMVKRGQTDVQFFNGYETTI